MNAESMSVDPVEIARLKHAFGAPLSEEERALVAAAPGPRGPSPAWLRECLAAWNSAPGPGGSRDPESERRAAGPPDLVARFEETSIAKAERFLANFPYFLMLVLGISGLASIGLVYAKTGGMPLEPFFQVLLVEWGLLGAFAFACWRRARRTLREEDLVRFLSARETGAHRSPATRALTWAALAVLVFLQARRSGWLKASAFFVVLLVGMYVAARLLRRQEARRRMREDSELWSWWYGTAPAEEGDRPRGGGDSDG